MVRSAAVLTVLVLCVSLATGLKCYQCSGCEEGQRGHPVDCSSSLGQSCAKLVLGSRVEKSCTPSAACQLGNVEQGFTDLFNGLSSAITGDESDPSSQARVIHCCDSDYCNNAGTALPTLGLLLAPAIAALLR